MDSKLCETNLYQSHEIFSVIRFIHLTCDSVENHFGNIANNIEALQIVSKIYEVFFLFSEIGDAM